MNTTASSVTLRKNVKRAAEAMLRKGAAPAVDYVVKPSDNGRFEIVWKIARAPPLYEVRLVPRYERGPGSKMAAGTEFPDPAKKLPDGPI